MAIQPLADRVLLKVLEAEEKTQGGIILPDTAKEKPQEGEVVEVGPGKLLDNGQRGSLSVAKGDRILFGKYAGTEIKVEGQEYLMIREDEILAIIK
ncbi:co-chaperone GroES [PVC group bacterium (ex Bugula neritina AB1)]|nr:co-chaperone GroES [PVC group bacterium (ex Bugula neritina AB1)]